MNRISLQRRPGALVVSLLVTLLVAGVLGVAASRRDAAAAAPAAATQVLSTTDRALCIKEGSGLPQSLWVVAATGLCPKGFWGPATLEDAFGIDLSALVAAEVAKQVKAPAKAPVVVDDDEAVAPTLKLNATPSTTSVALKWTAAEAPGDDTVIGYQIRYRRTTVTTWTDFGPVPNVLTRTVTSLEPGVKYQLQVRARYNTSDGGYGSWSNTVTATTDDV